MATMAVYLRLSLSDEGRLDESNSITNQRELIQDYIQHNISLKEYEIREYCDDGYSGTHFNRPAVKELLQAVKANKINCIIVKDLSRFSRDYIELGTYLNQIFPFMGIRFIAISDHYDSTTQTEKTIEMDTAFKTLLYDLYSKDISEKVKASIHNKCEAGTYFCGQLPFGYERDQGAKGKIKIKEKEAVIVRHIFELAVAGNSSVQIAKQLQQEGVPTITQLRKRNGMLKKRQLTWSYCMIHKILNNRFYLGEITYGKTARLSVGSSKVVIQPREKWHIMQAHHEPIVSESCFKAVASPKVNRYTQRRKRRTEKNIFAGKLFCGGCGYAMVYKPQNQTHPYDWYECYKHAQLENADCCTGIHAVVLKELILYQLNSVLKYMGNTASQRYFICEFNKKMINQLKNQQRILKKRLRELINCKNKAYEAYVMQQKTSEAYKTCSEAYENERKKIQEELAWVEGQLIKWEQKSLESISDMNEVIKQSHIEQLTSEIVAVFIKKIQVFSEKQIEIQWQFSDRCYIR